MTRLVTVFEFWQPKVDQPFEIREVGAANFHQFGVDYEYVENGAGMFSTAIVEMPDGQVRNVPVELIRFDED